MAAYYNEIDGYAARWLRNLVADGLIPGGAVDERSIVDVRPDDLAEYTQCHFFAGIGGWPYALRLAGWSDDRPVWTASCPCQPLSSAGQRKGHADERHLWPAFYRLIAECHPPVCLGEQVASKLGREWLAGVRADLEGVGYAVGAANLCAASVGAPHIRQRLYWVGDSGRDVSGRGLFRSREGAGEDRRRASNEFERSSGGNGLAHSSGDGRFERWPEPEQARQAGWTSGTDSTGLADAGGERRQQIAGGSSQDEAEDGRAGWNGSQPDSDHVTAGNGEGGCGLAEYPSQRSPWAASDCVWIGGRRIKSGIQPLAHGVPQRVAKLRAIGNAIVPPLAAEFIRAFMRCLP